MSKNGQDKGERLTPKNAKLIKALAKGNNITEASKIAGYNRDYVSTLLKKPKMLRQLEKVGLTDLVLAKTVKKHIEDGLGVKATAQTSLHATELALRLKGYGQTQQKPQNVSQTNILVEEYNAMTDTALNAKLEAIQKEIKALK